MKLAIFDFDSTLMDGETLEILSKETAYAEKIKEITNNAMKGELDFFESLSARVLYLKGLSVRKVNEICNNLPVMNGAEETVFELKKRGYKVVCFSGGFKNATIPFAEKLKLDGEFSNILHSKSGVLTGYAGGEMMFGESKGDMLKKLQKLLNIPIEDTITIGDGANDLSMFKYSGIRIAFRAKPILEAEADIKIREKDLKKLLEFI